MILLVKVIGIFIACMGAVIILNPQIMKNMVMFWRQGKKLYFAGVLRILFGVIFLLSVSRAKIPVVMLVFGIFSLIAGILVFILGLEKIRGMLDWWQKRPNGILRLMALLVLILGFLIVYSA
jgi:hypothetical protein